MKLHPIFKESNKGRTESELFEVAKEMIAAGQTLDCECDNCSKLYNKLYLFCACIICGGSIEEIKKVEPQDEDSWFNRGEPEFGEDR